MAMQEFAHGVVSCCQNRESKGTGQRYGLHSSASSSVHNLCYGASRLTEEEERIGSYKLRAYTLTVVINGIEPSIEAGMLHYVA